MSRDPEFELEEIPAVHTKTVYGSAGQRKPPKKTSYESHAEVQRWLKEQAVEETTKSAFNPTLIASRRDRDWILSSLAHFYEEGFITDVLHVVKSGKEATVYCCAADPSVGTDYLAAKVYRPRMFRSLKNDAIYRRSRGFYDEDGNTVRGSRRQRTARRNDHNRSFQVSSWITYEFETQLLLANAGADVPRPLSHIGNAVLMEYIGDLEEPAPLLRDVTLSQAEAQPLFECILRNIELSLAHDRIHGDLSEYNILYWGGAVTLIDFAQAVDPRQNPAVFTLLVRDIERICQYFANYGVEIDADALAVELWTRYQGPM